MDCGISVQLLDPPEEIVLCRTCGQLKLHRMQLELPAHLVLRSNVGARSGVVADQNDRESRRRPACLQQSDFAPQLCVDLFSHRAAVDQFVWVGQGKRFVMAVWGCRKFWLGHDFFTLSSESSEGPRGTSQLQGGSYAGEKP